MERERWQRIEDLYHRALELENGQRTTFLEEACRGDESLRGEVESLLSKDGPDPVLDRPAASLVAETATVIGRYRLLQKIGEGGGGEVWLAEQKEPVRRRVAMKLVKAGLNTREVMARFESERQALALMDHPAIAKVFDAGATPEGAPYFVMEYVAGVPITAYCDNHSLGVRERLELIMHVCGGVQHAHQKAIIHRDLKPSNILVTEVDGRAAPKIIDFGVAKALTQRLTADTLFTRVGTLVGTPAYMSPEQANSSGEDIDTRTDVYSLGVILYELLAGATPIEPRKIALEEFLRRLREDEPQKPSTRIRTQDRVTWTDMARKRQTEPLALAKLMRGDLDSITLKALEKDRSRRYGSPSDLAADIGRHLKHEAVLAVPPSAAYRARKFAYRHRAALITTAAFVSVLIAAAAISIRQSIRANRETAVAQAINDFLQNDLLAQAGASAQAGPNAKADPHLEVRTALDRAAARISGKFEKQPEVEASIRQTIGDTYADLGLFSEAQQQEERALAIRRRSLGDVHPATLESMDHLAVLYRKQGKYAQAEPLRQTFLEVQRRLLGELHPATLDAMNNLALLYRYEGKTALAEPLYTKAVEGLRHLKGVGDIQTIGTTANLAQLYDDEGKYEQAERLFDEVLAVAHRTLGEEHPYTMIITNNLAQVYREEGRFAQAESLQRKVVETESRVLGAEHPDTLMDLGNLAKIHTDVGKYPEAEEIFGHVLKTQSRLLGDNQPTTLTSMALLGSVKWHEGKYAEAERLLSRALEGQRRVLGNEHPSTLTSLVWLGRAWLQQNKYSAAEVGFREALQGYTKTRPEAWQRYNCQSLLGASLAGERKYDEAEPLLLSAYQGMIERRDKIPAASQADLISAGGRIVDLYKNWSKPASAAEWQGKLQVRDATPKQR